jgi:hypothetical protein
VGNWPDVSQNPENRDSEIPQRLANSRECRANFFEPDIACRDGTGWLTRQSRSNQSLHQNSLLTGKLTGNFAVLGVVLQIWHPIHAKLQSVAVKFPKQKNREFFEANREITKLNRDQPAAVRHHVRNSLLPSTLTRFSLEGEELGSNILHLTQSPRPRI